MARSNPKDWTETIAISLQLTKEHFKIIKEGFQNGLATSYWSKIKGVFDDRRKDLHLSKKDLANRIGCAQQLLSETNWPTGSTPMWLPLAYSIAVDMPLTNPEFSYRPIGLRLDGYEFAIKAISSKNFVEILPPSSLIDKVTLSLCSSVRKVDILTVLYALGFCEIPVTTQSKIVLLGISRQINSNMDSILSSINEMIVKINIPSSELSETEFQNIVSRYTLPMLIALAGLGHEPEIT